jgi:hypothetical protein
MAHEPFTSNGDATGTSGVSGYGTNDTRSPALGRSSRDLALDSGPGAAPQEMFTTPDIDTQTTTGAGQDRTTISEPSFRDRKTNPDPDPDARLGLRPSTGGMVAPRQPAYPASGPKTRAATGAIAGTIGGTIATALWYALFWAGASPVPSSLAVARNGLGLAGLPASAVGVLGSVIAAAAWGGLFGLLVRKPTLLKGMIFGLLPALAPLSKQPMFFGATGAAIALPLLFCVFVWGGLTGYFAGRWLRPPYSGAVEPDLTTAGTEAE